MNNKGELDIGVIISLAIVLIVGVILFQASAQQVGDVTNTVTVANQSFTGVANDTVVNIAGKSWSNLVVYNTTGNVIVLAANYTLANNQVVNGEETATLTPDATLSVRGHEWNLSGTYQPTTYISDGGGRAISNLIIILFAVALVAISVIAAGKNREVFSR